MATQNLPSEDIIQGAEGTPGLGMLKDKWQPPVPETRPTLFNEAGESTAQTTPAGMTGGALTSDYDTYRQQIMDSQQSRIDAINQLYNQLRTQQAETKDLYFVVFGVNQETGKIYKSNSTELGVYANNFIGFADNSVATSSSCIVNVTGIDNNQTSLTPGTTYYLSNTSGAISTSAGTVSRKIGLSLSATEILIKHDNP